MLLLVEPPKISLRPSFWTSFRTARMPPSGVDAESTSSNCSFRPSIPPLALISFSAISTPYLTPWPTRLPPPVRSRVRPTLIGSSEPLASPADEDPDPQAVNEATTRPETMVAMSRFRTVLLLGGGGSTRLVDWRCQLSCSLSRVLRNSSATRTTRSGTR